MQTKSKTNLKKLKRMRDEEIDFSDIPAVDPKQFKKMVIRMPAPKPLVSIRLDPEVLDWFKKQGKGYQTRINSVLRGYVKAQSH
ncbi:MAG: 3-oxoacyl-ACP synthase [Verrucomicrobia bacterium]|nr:MAG: 3-oxoacyl-ACP synthase [Verrucomicrobiota bacterium]